MSVAEAYIELRSLVAAPRSARAFAIGSLHPPAAAEAAQRHQLNGASDRADQGLLLASQADDDRGALLCLRCRVSQAAEQKLLALHRQFGRSHRLDLVDMAATVLDDRGELLPWPDPETPARGRPFNLDVLLAFQPERSGLGHWTRVRVQSHGPLADLLRCHGLLLIRDWALLAHSSPTRMARAWRLHGRDGLDLTTVARLHGSFAGCYGRALADSHLPRRRWEPSDAFLQHVDPAAPPRLTRERLQSMAGALRRERLGQTPSQADLASQADRNGAPGDLPEEQALLEMLEGGLRQALARQLPAMLASSDRPLSRCLWRHYAQGLRQRAIAEQCGCSQAMVSRRLQERAHASTVATTALELLAGQPGLEAIGRCQATTERLVEALRTHLLEPAPDGDRSRMAQWLASLLPTP